MLSVTTAHGQITTYYSKSTGNLNLVSSWGRNIDGSGASPSNFTDSNQLFNIRNNPAPTIGANWTVSGALSKVVLGDGTNNINFTIPASFRLTGVIDLSANSQLTLQNTTLPTFGAIDPASTIVYAQTGNFLLPATPTAYGNLQFSGGGIKTQATGLNVSGLTTVDLGTVFATGGFTFTGGSSTNVNGGFRIDQGGGVAGNDFTYGSSGTLIFNTSSGWYGVGATSAFWPSANSPVNVTVTGNGGNIELQATRTVTGLFQTSGGVRRNGDTTNNLIISGTLQLNKNGFFSGFSPTYTNTSTLVYNIHGQIAEGNEWGIGSGAGYGVPQNVTLQGHTRLDMLPTYIALPGNLLLSGAGDTLASYPNTTDIYIGGNWTRNDSAVYLAQGGGIFFQGTTDQTITAPGGQLFDYLGVNNYGANVVLNCNITVTTMIFFTNGRIVTGADTLFLT